MADAFDSVTMVRWRADPIAFIEYVLHDPETSEPFVLLPAEREFLKHAFRTDDAGRLLYPELCYSCPKKSGKTTFAGIFTITIIVLFGGRFGEAICCANDYEQSVGRVFTMIRRIIECSPLLLADAKITADKITIVGATIIAIPSDYASAAGSNQTIAIFDESWAYTSESSNQLWDEMVPPPTRQIACRLTVTYAGFSGESTLLEGLYKRGLEQPLIGTDLHGGDGILMFWTHEPVAPWQDERWLCEMRRSLRPNQYLRMIENRFVSGEAAFLPMPAWDECVDPRIGHTVTDRNLAIWIGVDASTKHDSTAIAAVTFDTKAQQCRLVTHRVFQPSPDQPLDFEATVEATLLDLSQRFNIRKVLFDPYQMQATSQRLTARGIKIEEFPQTSANLTTAAQNLFELVSGHNLVCYPDAATRLAVSRAIAVESPRGWRIDKAKQSHKIDIVIALAMACYAAVQGQNETTFLTDYSLWVDDSLKDPEAAARSWAVSRYANYIQSFNPYAGGGRWR